MASEPNNANLELISAFAEPEALARESHDNIWYVDRPRLKYQKATL